MIVVLYGLLALVLFALFVGIMDRWIERTEQARFDLATEKFEAEFTEWCARELDDLWSDGRAA